MEYTPALDYPHTGALLISSLRLGPEARKQKKRWFSMGGGFFATWVL